MRKPTLTATKRLTPKPEVLRELYLLSGNKCAMPGCENVILDAAGVVVGHICHIEAALPDGARFNPDQTDEDRRATSNLILLCSGHHKQIDSKQHEGRWTIVALRKIKADHEAKFKGLENSLKQAFQNEYVDSTDSLNPLPAQSFAKLERLVPDCKVAPKERKKRKKEIDDFLARMALVPDDERSFILGVVRRAIKVHTRRQLREQSISLDVEDIRSALGTSQNKLKKMGQALERYKLGSLDEVGERHEGRFDIRIDDPSEYLSWFDLEIFCKASGDDMSAFVLHLKFDLLD